MFAIRKIFLSVALLAWSIPSPGQALQQYCNPVGDSLFIADPYVLFHEGSYYLYGTSTGDGFRAWQSDDLVQWEPLGYVYRPEADSWATGSFWAPEVIRYQQKFYMVFSCRGPEGTGLRIALAVGDSPGGPFHELHLPLFDYNYSCIDGHLFIDDDGQPYLYFEKVGAVGEFWKGEGYLWGMIYGVKLSEDLSRMVQEPVLCLYPTQDWEHPESMHARSTEGMTVFRHDSVYYMTYSANHYADPGYGVGFATASAPLGMWSKSDRNPILEKNMEAGVSGPGHNAMIKSPDGREWFMVYHSHADPDRPSGRRVLNIDRVVFKEDGSLEVIGPTRTPQPLPSASGK
ncbi:MAG: glycoside hydrolase family 43 protein [Bacteroidota bacterium]